MHDQSVFSRRQFVAASMTLLGPLAFIQPATAAITKHVVNSSSPQTTIADVINTIRNLISFNHANQTVDTVKSGDPGQPVTGIVTTMFATIDVIRKAIEAKANLIIAHEPTFYNHADETDWIGDHDLYQYKRRLLEDNKIVVWRFHDYWHSAKPDGVLQGVLQKLGWQQYYNESDPVLLTIPKKNLGEIIHHVKSKLDVQTVRFIGETTDSCSRIVIIPGAAGGRRHIAAIQHYKPDLLIVGELQEWETSEYVRDARSKGEKRSLVVLGHVLSEEPGMEHLVGWLQPKFPELKITHIPSGNPFKFM